VVEAPEPAADLVAAGLRRQPPEGRGLFLRAVMAHAAAGLTVLEGERAASEVAYRLGDAVVSRPRS